MAEIINLRQIRKQRERAEKEAKAAANRRRFGRTKAERRASEAEEDRAARDLDGKQLRRDGPAADPSDDPPQGA